VGPPPHGRGQVTNLVSRPEIAAASASAPRLACLGLIVAGVVGLKVLTK